MNRRAFHFVSLSALASLSAAPLYSEDAPAHAWKDSELMEPRDLVAMLNSTQPRPEIICVAFPVLYRQRHIIHAEFAGPGSKPEGIDALKKAVASIPKDKPIVIYCGCCPWEHCPNIVPAYKKLKELGFADVKVLQIGQDYDTDWAKKGYPDEKKAKKKG